MNSASPDVPHPLRSRWLLPVLLGAALLGLLGFAQVALGQRPTPPQPAALEDVLLAQASDGRVLWTPAELVGVAPPDSFYTCILERNLFELPRPKPVRPVTPPPTTTDVVVPVPPPVDPGPPPIPRTTLLLTGIYSDTSGVVSETTGLIALLEDRGAQRAYELTNAQVIGPDTVVCVGFGKLELRGEDGLRSIAPGEDLSLVTSALPSAAGELSVASSKNPLVAKYDKDGDGKVTLEEYGGSRGMFQRLDKNGDGILNEEDGS